MPIRQENIRSRYPPPCPHRTVRGPFYIVAAASEYEPKPNPPSGVVPVEHCVLCGQVFIPPGARTCTGPNLATCQKAENARIAQERARRVPKDEFGALDGGEGGTGGAGRGGSRGGGEGGAGGTEGGGGG